MPVIPNVSFQVFCALLLQVYIAAPLKVNDVVLTQVFHDASLQVSCATMPFAVSVILATSTRLVANAECSGLRSLWPELLYALAAYPQDSFDVGLCGFPFAAEWLGGGDLQIT